jgi:hypothetical protein
MPTRRRSDSLPKRDPLREAIAMHAYERFLERCGVYGRDVEDWLAAESDLLHGRRPAHQTPAGDAERQNAEPRDPR